MKTMTKAVLAMLALGASTWVIVAQQNDGPGAGGPPPGAQGQGPQGGRGMRRPPPPIFAALDANHDGVIDAAEIANASTALKTLLKPGATTLSMEDVLGPPPRRMGGPGGGPGGPGPDGPGGAGPGGPGGPPPDNQ
jgi:hypothetical protein